MSLKPIKYIQIDDQKGFLYSAGSQSLLLPVTFVKALDAVFSQLVGEKGAGILIYKLGEALGKEYIKTCETILKKEKTKVATETKLRIGCSAIFMEAGWGKVEVLKINLAKNLLDIRISFSPSGEFLKKGKYNLERGIIAGIYKEVVNQEGYCQLKEEDREKHKVILTIQKKIPKEIKEKERLVLLSRRQLESEIKKTTRKLRERIGELQKFQKLTVGRELKMIELKEEIKKLKKELKKYKKL